MTSEKGCSEFSSFSAAFLSYESFLWPAVVHRALRHITLQQSTPLQASPLRGTNRDLFCLFLERFLTPETRA